MLCNQIENIEFQITKQCNMNCRYCSNNDGNLEKEHLADFEYIKVIQHLPNLKKITLTGGEPSISMELLDYISKEAKTKNISLQLNTNGFVNDIKVWDKLLPMFDIIHFSATNTMDKNLFANIRGVKADVFDIINKNIEYVNSYKDVITAVEILIGKFNINEIHSLYEFYKYRVDEIQFQPLIINGRASSKMQIEEKKLSMVINKILNEHKNATDNKAKLKLWCTPFFCQSIITESNNIECECGLYSIYVTNKGFVLPCNVAFYSDSNKSNLMSLKEHSIEDILANNPFYKELYKNYDVEEIKKYGLCKMFEKDYKLKQYKKTG